MWNYIIYDYFGNIASGQYWTIVGDVLLYVYLMIAFCYRKWDKRGVLMRFAEFASVWILRIFLSSLIYVIPPIYTALTGFNTLYVVFPLVILFYITVWAREKVAFRIVKGFAFYAFYILSFSFSYDVMNMIVSDPSVSGGVWREFIHVICMLLICGLMRKNDIRSFAFIPISSMILTTILSVLGIILCFLGRILLINGDKKAEYFIVAFHILFFMIEIVGYLLFFKSINEYNHRIDSEIEKKINQGGQDLIALAGANIASLRSIRHDVKNQYEIMSRLIKRKEYDKLLEYFSDYSAKVEESIRGSSSGNTVLDCLMCVEYAKADNLKVTIDDVFAVPPVFPIADVDMCGILFNIVDNAIEAASVFEDSQMRRVELSVRQHDAFCIIKCRNFVKEDKLRKNAGVFLSSKSEHGHGYGLNIVRGIVNKHNGEMKITAENGQFIVEILLQEEK